MKNISLPVHYSKHGALPIQITHMPKIPSTPGKKHVTNYWETPTLHKDGTSQSFIPFTPTSAWQASEVSSPQTAQYTPTKEFFWDKQDVIAKTIFSAWEPTYFMVCSTRQIPFPKCEWYHKYQYIHVCKQPQVWTSFFQDSPFST